MATLRNDGTFEVLHGCLNCGKAMDSMSDLPGNSDDKGPEPGSLAICMYCSYPMVIETVTDLGVTMRDPTRPEWSSVLRDLRNLNAFAAISMMKF